MRNSIPSISTYKSQRSPQEIEVYSIYWVSRAKAAW